MQTEISRFEYSRRQGEKRTYDVVVNGVRRESGVCTYNAWVHCDGEFKGNGLVFPLIAKTLDESQNESRSRIEDHSEHLSGVEE